MVSLNGVELPSGIADATFVSCDLGDNVRVTSVKGYIANYSIGAGAVVCDIGEMVTRPGATFGNGVEIEAVNEGGGRGIRMFNELSSQFAYLTAMHRYRTDVVEKLDAMVDACVAEVTSDVGTVGEGAVVAHVGPLVTAKPSSYRTQSPPTV